jgi:hypothetical protein
VQKDDYYYQSPSKNNELDFDEQYAAHLDSAPERAHTNLEVEIKKKVK